MSEFSNLNARLFGPLSSEYCIYFYFISIFSLFTLLTYIIPSVYLGIKKREGINYYISIISISFMFFINYFVSRLMYNMCSSSLSRKH